MVDQTLDAFNGARPGLVKLAYRMLGSIAEAEDIVQETWLRWSAEARDDVVAPTAYLRRTVARLCLDQIKSARAQRESYVGTWLPEPTFEELPIDDVTLPLLLILDRLSPPERAAFLLHDVFGESFGDIGLILDRNPAACRQLASRARQQIRDDQPRFDVPKERGLEIASAFFAATRRGEFETLTSLLAEDASFYSDGGGKRPALPRIISGREQVVGLHQALRNARPDGKSTMLRYGFINGLPGFVSDEGDGIQTTALLIEDGRIAAIYVMRNPDKLERISARIQ